MTAPHLCEFQWRQPVAVAHGVNAVAALELDPAFHHARLCQQSRAPMRRGEIPLRVGGMRWPGAGRHQVTVDGLEHLFGPQLPHHGKHAALPMPMQCCATPSQGVVDLTRSNQQAPQLSAAAAATWLGWADEPLFRGSSAGYGRLHAKWLSSGLLSVHCHVSTSS